MHMYGDSAELEHNQRTLSGPREPTPTYRMIEEELGLSEPIPTRQDDDPDVLEPTEE